MIWRWLIFSSGPLPDGLQSVLLPLVLLPALLCGQLPGAIVTGRVALAESSDSAVKTRKDFSGVVVWLMPKDEPVVRPIRKHVTMLQKDKRFSPHVLAIETGTSVDFPNLDPIFHNAFSNFDGKVFDVALYPPGSSKSVRFDRPGIVRVFCNIHPSMSAVIVVVDSSYFAVTERDGRFSLASVDRGTYELHVFHERATPETLDRLGRTLTVSDENVALPEMTISEAGYLPVAHKNKYGRDYPVNSDEEGYSLPVK